MLKPNKLKPKSNKNQLGRPVELTEAELILMQECYKHNIRAVDTAKHLGVSRQRVYYHYNQFRAQNLPHLPRVTPSVIESSITRNSEAYA